MDENEKKPLAQVCDPPSTSGTDAATAPRNERSAEDDILSQFKIGKFLGEGGFGQVYKGKRLQDGLQVAVKFVKKSKNIEYVKIPGHPTILPLEVGMLTVVNRGPKVKEIIQLLDWQNQPDGYVMVLECPPHCEDVFNFWNSRKRMLCEETARTIMAQATTAAHTCCDRGVFHSDIKLENLLINKKTLEVKLIDFGCGRLLKESAYDEFRGTRRYCPPEFHTMGKYHGKPATVWSLGVLLFVMLCGRFPKPEDLKMINDDIWSERRLSNECCHLIRHLLRENPSERISLEDIISHKWFKVCDSPPTSKTEAATAPRNERSAEDDILSQFKIGKVLGVGGFGKIYKGKRLQDGLQVAVKFVKKSKNIEYVKIPGHPTTLPLEVGMLTVVNRGPKVKEIIQLLDWQDLPDAYVMVLECPPHCEDVFNFWDSRKRMLCEDMARPIMAQATTAAHTCCDRGVFHSDIKLQNLLINTKTREVKLIDFRRGRFLKDSPYDDFRGTRRYCPPEFHTMGKYHGKPATAWSLGVLLFVMVCGRFPEPEDHRRIKNYNWSMFHLSNECCHLIRHLLRENPSERISLEDIISHKWFKKGKQ